MVIQTYNVKKIHVLSVPRGRDLVEYLSEYVGREGIKTGFINVIGSLRNAVIGYYDRERDEYLKVEVKELCELASGMGNISLKEDKPFIHLHVVLGLRDGRTYAGHLIKSETFIAETIIVELEGPSITREKETDTLWTWK